MRTLLQNQTPLILLCAGKSERFGSPKGLAPFGSGTWLKHQIESFREFSEASIFVTLGAYHREYDTEIQNLLETNKSLKIFGVENPHHEWGPFSSVYVAVRAVLNKKYKQGFILPVDVALPNSEVLSVLLETDENKDIIVPAYKEKGGHPVLLRHKFLQRISEADPKTDRLDHLIRQWPSEGYEKKEVSDIFVTSGFNTIAEYEALKDLIKA
ncbi:MAG: NTP transferase domain-containing protein [Bdellovibrionales bacterium]